MLVTGLCTPLLCGVPEELKQDSGALRFLQEPGPESCVLGRACWGSRVEKIRGQNQCIGTLMERSNRFGNFAFPVLPPVAIQGPHHWRKKTTSWKTYWEKGTLHFCSFWDLTRCNQYAFMWWLLSNMLPCPICHLSHHWLKLNQICTCLTFAQIL